MTRPPPRSLTDALALDELGDGAFVGAASGPPGTRVFGGLLVGQALRAAHSTVRPVRPARSLHASFMRPGEADQAIRYEVEPTLDGARFATRRVVGLQASTVVFALTASFQAVESGPEYEAAVSSEAPGPDGLAIGRYASAEFDSRDVPPGSATAPPHARSAWFRATSPVADDDTLHQHGLAMLSDHGPTRAVREPHLDTHDTERRHSVSLDHAVWFHRPARVDQWLLFELVPQVTTGGRGLAIGSVRTADGTLVATVAQEALLRIPS